MSARWEDLVRGIRQDPEPDAPRLVCADWLIDRGDVRGDYITLACRDAVAPRYSAEEAELRRQLYRYRPRELEWAKRLTVLGARGPTSTLTFHRGFIMAAEIIDRVVRNFPAICRLEPIIELTLAEMEPRWFRALAAMPELAELRYLGLRHEPERSRGCEDLFGSPWLPDLHELRVLPSWTSEIVAALARGTVRPRRLQVRGIQGSGVAALVAAGFFERLEDYHLADATDELVIELARAPLTRLRRLTFRSGTLSARAFRALGRRLDQLEHLSLDRTPLDRESAELLIAYTSSGNLRSLQHSGSRGSDGLDAFISSPSFRGVEDLDLIYGPFRPAVLEQSPHRGKLRKLSIGWGDGRTAVNLPGVEVLDNCEAGL